MNVFCRKLCTCRHYKILRRRKDTIYRPRGGRVRLIGDRNYDVVHLSLLFDINHTTVGNSIITWINYMYVKLGSMLKYSDLAY